MHLVGSYTYQNVYKFCELSTTSVIPVINKYLKLNLKNHSVTKKKRVNVELFLDEN